MMGDFPKELEGKAYLLVSGAIDLDEFKSWYALAQAAKAQPSMTDPEPSTQFQAMVEKLKAEQPRDEFEDYSSRHPRPTLDTPPEPDPEWAVGTGDRKQWPPG